MTAADEGRVAVEWNWLYGRPWKVLHHFAPLPGEAELIGDGETVNVMKTTCRRVLRWVSIPGPMSRLGNRRCMACCDALGYPHGTGSPLNDEACKPLVEARLVRMGLSQGAGANLTRSEASGVPADEFLLCDAPDCDTVIPCRQHENKTEATA